MERGGKSTADAGIGRSGFLEGLSILANANPIGMTCTNR